MEGKRKKISALGVTRRLIQLAAFVLFPGLFITTFSAIKDIYTSILHGSFDTGILAQQLILTAAVLLITAIMGRFFCGFLCSFGAMGDLLWFVGKKLKLPRPKLSETTDRVLKCLKYVLLLLIAVFVWTLGAITINSSFNPWTIFGMYATIKGWPGVSYLFSVGSVLLLLIIFGSLFIERFFCRYLCPLGAIFALISRFRLFRIQKPSEHCGSCRACTKRCSMGIPLYRSDRVNSGECIDCFHCVPVCPRNNVTANPNPAVASVIAATALTGLYYVGNLAGDAASAAVKNTSVTETTDTTTSTSSDSVSAKGQYTDGTYTGSASGYRGTTKVQVTVANGYITDVSVLSTGDDMEFFNKAKNTVIAEIKEAQSTNVDTVSGATFSSNGIINAVANALSGTESSAAAAETQTGTDATSSSASAAQKSAATSAETTTKAASTSSAASSASTSSSTSSQSVSTSTATSTASSSSAESSSSKGSIALADGTYTGSGTGFRGTTTVSVTVSNGTITAITVKSYADDAPYFSRAKSTVIAEILKAQSVSVSTVSGATFSSNGILEAVADALNLDFTNSNSTLQSQSHGGPRG
jgi:uncharacterized protein with FMN-binding domain